MKRFIVICLAMLLELGPLTCVAETAVGMVTGSTSGTYYRFGKEIAEVAEKEGTQLLVKPSQGSLDNIRRMMSKENAALGIVQSDVMEYLSNSDDPKLRRVTRQLRMIFPFYNEEVHILARKNIKKLQDLQGKRVIVGTEGSGTWMTAVTLLRLAGVRPAENPVFPPKEAVAAVLQNKADAMFYVAGKPVTVFRNLNDIQKAGPEFAALLEQVHFVPIKLPRIVEKYPTAELTQADYAWVTETTPTVAVKAVLISFDFSARRNPYYRMRCGQLAKLGQAVRGQLGHLQEKGHPKWKQVELNADLKLWTTDTCSKKDKDNDGITDQRIIDILSRP